MDRWYLLLPLVSAFLYSIAAMSQKRAMASGLGPWRMAFLTLWAIGLAFIFFIFLDDPVRLPDPVGTAVFCGVLFTIGQMLTILSIEKGDVSVATPVLGSKVVMVVIFLALFTSEHLSFNTWVAAILTSVGIILMQWEPRREKRAQVHGFYRFIATSSGVVVILALGLIPLFRAPLWKLPAGSGIHVAMGTD